MGITEEIFINHLKNDLAKEGEEICEEFESKYAVTNDLKRNKAYNYCLFIVSYIIKENEPGLYKRCLDYVDCVNEFNRYESLYKEIKNEREVKIDLMTKNIKLI